MRQEGRYEQRVGDSPPTEPLDKDYYGSRSMTSRYISS